MRKIYIAKEFYIINSKKIFIMEISKSVFRKWFDSQNQQISGNAMRIQWTALLENTNPFFSEDELWNEKAELATSGLCFAINMKPKLLAPAIQMIQTRLSEDKYVPFEIWPDLIGLSAYQLKNVEDRLKVRDFVLTQTFDSQELFQMIASVLRCVDRMPEWLKCGMTWIAQVSPSEDFGLKVHDFLTSWGRLDEYSNALVMSAFDKILPEQAPMMIRALTHVPGPYRFDLSLCLLKKYFNDQPMDVVKAIVGCFEKDSDVVLQQKLLDGIFNFFNKREQNVDINVALVFIDGISQFLLEHWAENCFKFGNFWDEFHYAPEVFDIIRGALKNDWNFVAFDKGSKDPLAKLKTPIHMLCYLPVVNRADLCLLLLKAVSRGKTEVKNLACRILMEKEDFLQFTDSFDAYQCQLEEIILQDGYPISYEINLFVSAIANALVKYGSEVKSVAKLYDFIQVRGLKVPALNERYGQQVEELVRKRSYEKEVLDYLLKH